MKIIEPGLTAALGLTAAPGIGVGAAVFDPVAADGTEGPLILVCQAWTANFAGLLPRASGLVALTGGITCDAAIVARSAGIACLVGCFGLRFDASQTQLLRLDGSVFARPRDRLRVDADRGLLELA